MRVTLPFQGYLGNDAFAWTPAAAYVLRGVLGLRAEFRLPGGFAEQDREGVVLENSIMVQATVPPTGKERMGDWQRRLFRRQRVCHVFTQHRSSRDAAVTGCVDRSLYFLPASSLA